MGDLSKLTTAGPLRTLAWSTLVNNAGNGAFAATAVVYLNQVQNVSGTLIGAGFSIAAVVALLSSVPVGLLADRGNPATQAAIFAGAAGAASALYAFVTGVWSFFLVAVLYALLERGSVVSRQTLIGVVFTGPSRTAARALLRSVSNVGAALGTGVAALVLNIGTESAYQVLFVINAITYFLAGFLLFRVVAGNAGQREPEPTSRAPGVSSEAAPTVAEAVAKPPSAAAVLRDRPYAIVSAVNALLTVHIVVLEVILPLWVVNRTEAPQTVVALLLLANTVIVILFQLPMSRPFDTVSKAVAGLRVAALLLSAMFLLLHLSSTVQAAGAVALLIVAAAAQTGAEMVQGATSWPLSYDLAPPGRIGEYQGFFGVAELVVQIAGPVGLTLLLIDWTGPGALVLAVVFGLVAAIAPSLVRGLLADRPSTSV